MLSPLTNVSFDGSPVRFWLDSPLLACFDPLALDGIRASLPADGGLLERVNVNYPAMSCYTIPDFRTGMYTLDPRDIQRFGDEEEDFDYTEGEPPEDEHADNASDFPFAAVDSGALIVVDVSHLAALVNLMTWEQYDRGLQDDAYYAEVIDALGGPYFALISSGPGMAFDGDGMYTIPITCVRASGR
jgi:hypothetical protein